MCPLASLVKKALLYFASEARVLARSAMTKLCAAGSTRAAVLARSARTLSSAKQEAREERALRVV